MLDRTVFKFIYIVCVLMMDSRIRLVWTTTEELAAAVDILTLKEGSSRQLGFGGTGIDDRC